jgi:hypothetical protein
VKRVREDREELGKRWFQAMFTKTLSMRWSVGSCQLLDQVYSRSVRGSLIRARLLITSLKASASSCLKEVLFLSILDLMRLKSPMIIHGVSSEGQICSIFERKLGFSE